MHADAASTGDVAEGGSHEGLADADRSHDEGVAGLVDEAHGDQLGPDGPVIGDLGALVPGLEHHVRIELGRPGPHAGRGGVAAGHLVAEELLEELDVGEFVAAGQGQALGQGGEELAEFQRRMRTLSSGETVGVGALIAPPR